jgi:hypothetical protein
MLSKGQYREIFGIDFNQRLTWTLSRSAGSVNEVTIYISGNPITFSRATLVRKENFDELRLSEENFDQLQHYLTENLSKS